MKEPFDPGRLRHRMFLQAAARAADGAGGTTAEWETEAAFWASIAPVKAGEADVAAHLAGIVTHKVTLRRRSDIDATRRLVHRGRVFRILAVHDPEEARRFQVALCAEETP